MSIKIVGSPDKNFTPYVHRAAKFYADRLLTKQMQENTKINPDQPSAKPNRTNPIL